MVKVDKNSWHYKLVVDILDISDPIKIKNRGLCHYVRMIGVALLMCVTLFVLVEVLLMSLISVIVVPIINLYLGIPFDSYLGSEIEIFVVVGMLLYAFAIVIGMCVYLSYQLRKWQTKMAQQSYDNRNSNKPPSVFKEYWKAIHDKICPSIKIINSKDME